MTKLKSRIALAIAAIALLCFVGFSSKAERPSKTTWEYKLVTVYGYHELPPLSLQRFNDLGADGWELVTIRSDEVLRGDKRELNLVYYFKRPA
jgi:hypothetical protein